MIFQEIPKKLNIWLPALFSFILVGGMFIGMKLQQRAPTIVSNSDLGLPEHLSGQGKMEEILRYVDAKYVDNIDRETLISATMKDLLKDLDPHSQYFSAEELKTITEELEGSFEGIGIEFSMVQDTILVTSTMPDSPAAKAGILGGDKVISIQDSLLVGKKLTAKQITAFFRGKKDSEVKIGVLRQRNPQFFTMKRDKISVQSIDAAFMLNKETGYIKLNRFNVNTYEEFMKSLEDLVEKQQMKHLVIDVRQNPGGYLQEATQILNQFFEEKGKLLVYTQGQSGQKTSYETKGSPFFKIGKIAVLIDENSASASEILAGAIQDWERGVIVGRRSFGKGLVQEQYTLRDGSALRLTVARYYTPSGRCIQMPYKSIADAKKMASATKKDTSFRTVSGRVVHGSGGIMPDIVVPLDTTYSNAFYQAARIHVPGFIFHHLATHHNAKPEMNAFMDTFSINETIWNDFLHYLEGRGIKSPTKLQLNDSKEELRKLLKARIAKVWYGDEGLYRTLTIKDPILLKAIQRMEK